MVSSHSGDNYLYHTLPSNSDQAANRERLEKAAAHFRRGLALAREDDYNRRWGERALLRIYGPQELDRPVPTVAAARVWQKMLMVGVTVPNPLH